MSLRNVVGCIKNLRKEVTDFEVFNEPLNNAITGFTKVLQDCSAKNPLGESRSFWYLKNTPKTGLISLRYGISSYGDISRDMEYGSDLEWAVALLVRVIDNYCKANKVGWDYFVLPNSTLLYKGNAVLYTDGVGLYGDSPEQYAEAHCELNFYEWRDGIEKPLSLLKRDTTLDPKHADEYIRRDIVGLISIRNPEVALEKYNGVLEMLNYTQARYAFNIDGVKYILKVKY